MAEIPKPEEPKANPLEKAALERLASAKKQKSYRELDFKECYFFASPLRQRDVNSSTQPAENVMNDAGELNTDEAFLLCQDFVTEVVNAFMPEAKPWCERGPGMDLPDGVWGKVEQDVRKGDQKIFGAMKASNLYPEIAKAFYPDLSIGTVGIWIERPHSASAIVNSAIPLRELEVNLGPYGEIDDRFAVRYTRNCYVRELVGEDIWGKMPTEMKAKIDEKPAVRTQVIWGFWRDWADKGDEAWQHVLLVGNKLVHDSIIKGEGSCPLLVMRFNPTADSPFGYGPLIQGLPSLRQIDEAELMLGENAELALRPPIGFPDDSFSNVENGLEPGMAYPIRPGSEGALKAIYTPPAANPENYAYEMKLKKLRKLFFVDLPEQTGDTPPTLGQWLDEMARAQRRIGTPGLPFWREGPVQIFLRFKYLLEASKSIEPVKVDGRSVATLPRNPAQAAAEQQEIAEATRTSQILGGMFPEEWKMNVDGRATIEAWLKKSRVSPELIVLRNKDDVAKAVDQMAKLAGARHVGDPGDATGGQGAV